MRKIFTILALSLLCFGNSIAQGTWTFAAPTDGAGSSGAETGRSICTDANGNTYVMGVFNGAGVNTDFDLNSSSTNTATASTNDGFIASYDKNGNFRWKTIVSGTGSDFGAPAGNICTNGTFVWVAGSVNVTGSAPAPTITSSTNSLTVTSPGTGVDAFVAKMNCLNGAVIWQQGFGGTGANDFAMGICVDPNGCAYVSGAYSSSFTLGSVTFPAISGTISDIYIAKFTPGGVLRSVQTGGSTVQDFVNAGSGLCYVPGAPPAIVATGHTGAATANFGAFTGLTNSGAFDACLVELDTALTGFNNALVFGSTGSDELLSAVYDSYSGGVFVSGFCSGSITFPGTAALTGLGGQDIVIARYSVATNNFVWSSIAGGAANDRGWCVAADGYGGIFLSGYSAGACTFSGSVSMPANAGLNDLFVTRYSPSGTPVWVLPATSSGSEEARGIACYVETSPAYSQSIFVTGITNTSAVSFGSTSVGNDGGNDFFLAKINDANVPLTATQSQVNLTCNNVCTGSATVVASGGTSPYTYSWSPSGGSGATASSLCAGSYTCTITDAVSSSITKTFTITQPPAISVTAASQTNVSCFGGSNGAASINTPSGGTGGFTYNWTPGNPTGDGTVSVTGLTATTYTCTVTDANACTKTQNFTITAPTAITVTPASQTNVSCFGGSNGAASINTPTGGAGGYTYDWTPGTPTGDGTVSVTGLSAQTYTCTVTDANGCTKTQNFTITAPTAITVTPASQTNVSCFGGSNGAASINTPTGGAGGYTYNWTPGNPTGDGTVSVTGLTATTYTCTVTDANSCTKTQNFTITAPTAIVVTPASQTNVSCFGGSNGAASINTPTGGAGGYTYNWTPGNPTGDGTVSVTGLTATTWTCTVTDANSCTSTQNFTLTAPTAIVVTPASQTNVSCFGGSNGAASINTPTGGAGGYTYNWTPGNPTGDGTVSVTGLTATTYTCTVTDANSCTATQNFTLTAPTAITVTPASQTNVSCFGGSNGAASINTPTGGAGGYTYDWTPGTPTGDGTVSVTGLTAQTYTCTVTDANGCTKTQNFTITAPTAIVVTPASQTNVACFGGSTGAASINTPTGGAGGYTYDWTPGTPTGDGTISVTGLSAQTYTCTVTDANGCTKTQNFTITAPTALVVTPASQTNVSCFGGSNGAASINTPTGGAGGFTYNWTPGNPTGDGTVSVTGLTAQTYTCTVTDANGCTATQNFTLTAPTAIVVTPASQTNASCFGASNGAASINTPTGGAGGYTYNWTPGNPTGDGTVSVTGLTAQTYTCTVTDANGCTATQNFTITAPTAITVTPASQTNVSCFGGSNGAASINTPTGGAGGYTYDWTPGTPTGDGTVSITGLSAQTYTCTVTDANGCTSTQNFTITAPTAITVTPASQTNVSCFGGSNGAASINTPTGGAGGFTYNWTPGTPTGDGTISVTGLSAQTYTCTVTDANGCTATQNFTITAPTAIVVTPASQTNVSCFGGSNGAASINTPTGGAGGFTYNWTPGNPTGDGTVSVTGLTAQTYTCTVTDANGCTAAQNFTLTAPTAIVVTPASQTNASCFGGSNGAASINTPTGGAGGYTYDWTPGTPAGDGTVSVSGLSAQTYTCTVTDANGCTATQNFTITSPTAITASISSTATGCTVNNGTATVSGVSGGAGGYTYSWSPSGGSGATATNLGVGTYTCTITDANGCTIAPSVAVTTIASPTLTAASQTNVSCFGGSNGAAAVNPATGGAGGYSYNWTPGNPTGDGTVSVTGLTATAYTCTVTDLNGCTASQTFTITQPPVLTVNAIVSSNYNGSSISCNGAADGQITAIPSGGTGSGYTFLWSNGQTNATATGLIANNYSVVVTDANGCTATSNTVTLTQPLPLTAALAPHTNVSCFGGSNGTASITVTGGTGSYAYDWTPGTPIGDGTNSVSGLSAGTITCDVTDVNGCVLSVGFTITQPTQLVLTAASETDVTCFGASNGTASVNPATGGAGGYTYDWTPGTPTGDGTTSVSGLAPNTYTCTVTDANGCTTNQSFTITETPAAAPTAVCQNVTVYLDATGTATIVAADIDGGSTVACGSISLSASQTAFTCGDLGTNTVTLSVTGSGGTTTCNAIVTVIDTIAPTASNPATLQVECIGDAIVDVTDVTGETDNCGTPTVTFVSDVSDGQSCPETITRTYNVADANGNNVNVTQTIIIHDLTPPTAPTPITLNAQCSSTVPAPLPSWVSGEVDNCSATVVAWVSDQSNGLSCPETITRTFSVTDQCNNTINVSQSIIVLDTQAPVGDIASLPELTANCDFTPPTATASDNCAGTINGTPDVAFPITAFGTTTVTWTYIDACGNTTTQTQDVTITPIDVTTHMANDGITFVVNNLGQTYQWIDCNTGQAIAGATNHNFTPSYGSDFAVVITQNGCSDTSACMNSTVGIGEVAINALTLYPNPTDGMLFISFEGVIKNIEVVDILGRVVNTPVSIVNNSVDATELAPGKYMMRITTDNNQVLLKEFIVQL